MNLESELLSNTPNELTKITKKVLDNVRLSIEEGLLLYSTPHEDYVNRLASFARERSAGNSVSYAITVHLYPSNICSLACPMCSFYAKEGDSSAFMQTAASLASRVEKLLPCGISQAHIVSGLYYKLTLDYYKELFTSILAVAPGIEIKALSAVEYDYLAAISNRSVSDILQEMLTFGLSFLPGGGAEIFDEGIRKQIAPKKISAARYLEIHRTAHKLGIRSNCTMLYNHIEEPIHILDHLHQIRTLQDETGGFSSFVPLKYHPLNNLLGKRISSPPNRLNHRLYPVSRLMLDNVKHLCALWNYEGLDQAQKLLDAGVSSIGNVIYDELVATAAGAPMTHVDASAIEACIRAANRRPLHIPNFFKEKEKEHA